MCQRERERVNIPRTSPKQVRRVIGWTASYVTSTIILRSSAGAVTLLPCSLAHLLPHSLTHLLPCRSLACSLACSLRLTSSLALTVLPSSLMPSLMHSLNILTYSHNMISLSGYVLALEMLRSLTQGGFQDVFVVSLFLSSWLILAWLTVEFLEGFGGRGQPKKLYHLIWECPLTCCIQPCCIQP